MKTALLKLVELEAVNQQIAILKAEVAELPKRVAAIESKLAESTSQTATAQSAIKSAEAEKRKNESEIQDWQQKIVKFREQSSSVKNNEQYKALMHEIEYAEQQIATCEERILVGMEANEGLQQSLQAADALLKSQAAEVESEKAHAKSLTAEDEKKLAVLNAQRDAIRAVVEPAWLSHYERIAAKRSNALAEAIDQKCSACNMTMRPQHLNELMLSDRLVTCESCSRILYYDPTHQSAIVSGGLKGSLANERAWLFQASVGNGRFIALANSKAGCTMRAYDAHSGLLVERAKKAKQSFREAFASMLTEGQKMHVANAHWDEDGDDQLASELLEELQIQAQISNVTSE